MCAFRVDLTGPEPYCLPSAACQEPYGYVGSISKTTDVPTPQDVEASIDKASRAQT